MSEEGRKTIDCEMLWLLFEDAWMKKRKEKKQNKNNLEEREEFMCVLSQLFSSRLPFVPLSIYLRMASLHQQQQQQH